MSNGFDARRQRRTGGDEGKVESSREGERLGGYEWEALREAERKDFEGISNRGVCRIVQRRLGRVTRGVKEWDVMVQDSQESRKQLVSIHRK